MAGMRAGRALAHIIMLAVTVHAYESASSEADIEPVIQDPHSADQDSIHDPSSHPPSNHTHTPSSHNESRLERQLDVANKALLNVKALHQSTNNELAQCYRKLSDRSEGSNSSVSGAQARDDLEACQEELDRKSAAPDCTPCKDVESKMKHVLAKGSKGKHVFALGSKGKHVLAKGSTNPEEGTNPEDNPKCVSRNGLPFDKRGTVFDSIQLGEAAGQRPQTILAGGDGFFCGLTNFKLVCFGERKYSVWARARGRRRPSKPSSTQVRLPVFEARHRIYTRRQCRGRYSRCWTVTKGGGTWKSLPWEGKDNKERIELHLGTTVEKMQEEEYIQVAAGHDHVCALNRQGRVRCFQVFFTHIPQYHFQFYAMDTEGGSPKGPFAGITSHQGVTKVAAAGATTCIISSGKLSCYGYRCTGKWDGNPKCSVYSRSLRKSVSRREGFVIPKGWKSKTFRDVAVGERVVCGILTDYSVRCRFNCMIEYTGKSKTPVCSNPPKQLQLFKKVKLQAVAVVAVKKTTTVPTRKKVWTRKLVRHRRRQRSVSIPSWVPATKNVTSSSLGACGILLESGTVACQDAAGRDSTPAGLSGQKVSSLAVHSGELCVILQNSSLHCTFGGIHESSSQESSSFKKVEQGDVTQFRAAALTHLVSYSKQRKRVSKQVVCGIGTDNYLHCVPKDFLEKDNIAVKGRFVQTGQLTDGSSEADTVPELMFSVETPCATTCMNSGIRSWACLEPRTSCTSCSNDKHLTIFDPVALAGTCTSEKCQYCRPKDCCNLNATSNKIFYHTNSSASSANSWGVCVDATDVCQAKCVDPNDVQGSSSPMRCDKGCNTFSMSNGTMNVCTARKHVTCRWTEDGPAKYETCDVERTVACRATCPKKFATRFWSVGPTCLLKVLQLGAKFDSLTKLQERVSNRTLTLIPARKKLNQARKNKETHVRSLEVIQAALVGGRIDKDMAAEVKKLKERARKEVKKMKMCLDHPTLKCYLKEKVKEFKEKVKSAAEKVKSEAEKVYLLEEELRVAILKVAQATAVAGGECSLHPVLIKEIQDECSLASQENLQDQNATCGFNSCLNIARTF